MTKLVDLGFALNYQYANLLDLTPEESEPTWGWIGPGITDMEQSREDKVSERDDYSTGGTTKTTVTGVNKEISCSGSRLIGDPVQEWLAGIEEAVGPDRETTYRVVGPDGSIVEEPVTVKNPSITGPSGASSDEQAISFTLSRNDTPTLVQEGSAKHLPVSVALDDAVTVKVGEVTPVSPTVEPASASSWCLYAIEDTEVASVTADGKVRGLKVGTTRLSIKCAAKPSVRVVATVTVTE